MINALVLFMVTQAPVVPGTDPLVQEMTEALKLAWQNAGWLGVLATGLMFSIRFFRLQVVQNLIPAKAKWQAWPEWLKWVLPFVLSFAGALILAIVAKVSWPAAIIGALTTSIGAIAGNSATKLIGEIEGAARTAKSEGYQPSPFRRAGSIVVPLARHIRENGPPPKP